MSVWCKWPCRQKWNFRPKTNAGTDFCIMHPYTATRWCVFFMPNIIHINGRRINRCISRAGCIKWVCTVPSGTKTDALRCLSWKRRKDWHNRREKIPRATFAYIKACFTKKVQNSTIFPLQGETFYGNISLKTVEPEWKLYKKLFNSLAVKEQHRIDWLIQWVQSGNAVMCR